MVAGLLQMVVSQNIEWTIVWPLTNMRARKSTFTNIQRELLSKWARTRKRTAMSKWNNNNIHHIHEGNGTAAVSLSLFDQHYEWKSYFFSHLFSKMFQKIDDCSNPLSKCTQTENSMRFSKNLNKISSRHFYPCVCVWLISFLIGLFLRFCYYFKIFITLDTRYVISSASNIRAHLAQFSRNSIRIYCDMRVVGYHSLTQPHIVWSIHFLFSN